MFEHAQDLHSSSELAWQLSQFTPRPQLVDWPSLHLLSLQEPSLHLWLPRSGAPPPCHRLHPWRHLHRHCPHPCHHTAFFLCMVLGSDPSQELCTCSRTDPATSYHLLFGQPGPS